MPQIKMKYGIDLGTTNSAICRMESGEPVIKKTDTLKDTLPSCVAFTRKRVVKVGDSAYNDLRQDKARATKKFDEGKKENVFIEFKRTMGLDKVYYSSNMGEGYSSEQLSAEVLKTLKSFITDEVLDAAVITVPAKFKADQIAATKRAAQLAGIKHSELLQEPIAAAMAYGLTAEQKNGNLLVFDFGGGTFDAALLSVDDGIMQVKDTEGDNYLGGKNLDYAIVDEILIPHLEQNFSIEEILADKTKKNILREAVKFYAEQAKNQLSFNEKADITSQLDEFGDDDNGEPMELDLVITQSDLEEVLRPIFQKSINITKQLLKRNNLSGSDITNLILVGGPTHSPILRQMLKDQVTNNINTSVDPMTAVASGAALYAAGRIYDSENELKQGTLALDVQYPSSTVNDFEFVSVRIVPEECKGSIPSPVYVEFSRDGWSSGKVCINDMGDVIECQLRKGRANAFSIIAYSDQGDVVPCFPAEFTIMQGMVVGDAVLPFNIGIEAFSADKEKDVFVPIPGLEKNKSIPAIGQKNDFFKTPKNIRPGMDADRLVIPIYLGEYGAAGTSATYNDHVTDIVITGNDVPRLVPADSIVNLTIKIDASQLMTVEIEFVAIRESIEKKLEIKARAAVTEADLNKAMRQANSLLNELRSAGFASQEELNKSEDLLNDVDARFESEKSSDDGRMHLLADIRKACLSMEELTNKYEWNSLERELVHEFDRLEKANNELGNEYDSEVAALKRQVNQDIHQKDASSAKGTLKDITQVFVSVTLIYQLINFIREFSNHFDSVRWKDRSRARQLLSEGMDCINSGRPTTDKLHPIVVAIIDCMADEDREKLKF